MARGEKFKALKVMFILLLSLIMLFGLANFVLAKAEEDNNDDNIVTSIKVLGIGNSFTDDALWHFYDIAKNLGVEDVTVGIMYIGSSTLENQKSNAESDAKSYDFRINTDGIIKTTPNYSIKMALEYDSWDYITLQQASSDSGIESTYNQATITYLKDYINAIMTNAENPNKNDNYKLGWHATWAYQAGSNHSGFSTYENNQLKMYDSITSVVSSKIKNSDFDFVVPSTTAIQNMRTSFAGDNLTRDGYHLSLGLGRFIAATTYAKTLIGDIDSLQNCINIEDMSDIYLDAIIESVNNAFDKPFEITESTFTEYDIDLVKYKSLDFDFNGWGYWNSMASVYNKPVTTESNSQYFYYSADRFTKEDIPVGSIIEIAQGYKYRPDSWNTDKKQNFRPEPVSAKYINVTEQWWGDATYKAFNISDINDNFVFAENIKDVDTLLKIYVPKSNKNEITRLQASGRIAKIQGTTITLSVPYETDLTKVDVKIEFSENATITNDVTQKWDLTNDVVIEVVAENGEKSTYTLKTTKEAQIPQTSKEPEPKSKLPMILGITLGGVGVIAIGIVLFIILKNRKSNKN